VKAEDGEVIYVVEGDKAAGVTTPRNEVRHKPTGASFTSYPGLDKVICSVKWGRCGLMLSSGDTYSRDEVEALASEIMTARVNPPAVLR
jgi:hypothetical protein